MNSKDEKSRNEVTDVERRVVLGRRIQKIRESKGITQKQLVDMLGCGANGVSSWERGASSMKVTTLMAIAECLNVPVASFFSESDPKEQSAPLSEGCVGESPIRPEVTQRVLPEAAGRETARWEGFATIPLSFIQPFTEILLYTEKMAKQMPHEARKRAGMLLYMARDLLVEAEDVPPLEKQA